MNEDKKEEPSAERTLLAAAQAGDSAAMMRLLEQYEPLLRRAAGQPHLRTLREDALAEGTVSFVRAVHDYDLSQSVPFAGFVKARVYGDLRSDSPEAYPKEGALAITHSGYRSEERRVG